MVSRKDAKTAEDRLSYREMSTLRQRRLPKSSPAQPLASETEYRRLLETMAQGVVYHAADGAIIAANPAAGRLLGLTLDQMQGRTSMDPRWRAIHEDGTPFPGETHPAMVALRTGQPVDDVVMGVFNSAIEAYRWLSVSAAAVPAGRRQAPPGPATFTDITEYQLTKERPGSAREVPHADREHEGRVDFDLNETLPYVSLRQGAARLYGRGGHAAAHRGADRSQSGVRNQFSAPVSTPIRLAVTTDTYDILELEQICKDGSTVVTEAITHYVVDPQPAPW